MLELHSIEDLKRFEEPLHLAIGVFDGVHLGHRTVIDRALQRARSTDGRGVVVTFHPHPLRVLRPDKAPRLLASTPHKIKLLRACGVDATVIVAFNAALADTDPEIFIARLVEAAPRLASICVGHEWSFGKDRRGNVDLLKTLGQDHGFEVEGISPVEVDGEVVSSTRIRNLVETGRLEEAARLLGRRFTILGHVVEGKHLGSKLGFPTANLATHNEQFPPNGVYAVEALWGDSRLPGVVNIGCRPTIDPDSTERILELHLFDFQQSLYGEELEVIFHDHLRPEKSFPDLGALKHQIAADADEARERLRTVAKRA